MSSRPVYLAVSRLAESQRAHFGIFIPNADYADRDPNDRSHSCKGTIIQVLGAPMSGYGHEFERNYDGQHSKQLRKMVPLGRVDGALVTDPADEASATEHAATGTLDSIALQEPAPRASDNFLAPVNDTTNRRCQEWTMDYVRRLVAQGYIGEAAIDIVQAERDPPAHGVGLRPVG